MTDTWKIKPKFLPILKMKQMNISTDMVRKVDLIKQMNDCIDMINELYPYKSLLVSNRCNLQKSKKYFIDNYDEQLIMKYNLSIGEMRFEKGVNTIASTSEQYVNRAVNELWGETFLEGVRLEKIMNRKMKIQIDTTRVKLNGHGKVSKLVDEYESQWKIISENIVFKNIDERFMCLNLFMIYSLNAYSIEYNQYYTELYKLYDQYVKEFDETTYSYKFVICSYIPYGFSRCNGSHIKDMIVEKSKIDGCDYLIKLNDKILEYLKENKYYQRMMYYVDTHRYDLNDDVE